MVAVEVEVIFEMLFVNQFIGPALTEKRKKAGLTIAELSKITSIPAATICRYENGTRMPLLDKAFLVNNILDDIIANKNDVVESDGDFGYFDPDSYDSEDESGDFWGQNGQ